VQSDPSQELPFDSFPIFMKRNPSQKHDGYGTGDLNDRSWSANQETGFERVTLRHTRPGCQPIVSVDHAPGLSASAAAPGCVRPEGDSGIYPSRSSGRARNQQRRRNEALAAGIARNAKQLNAQARRCSCKFPRGTLALGGGPGLPGRAGVSSGSGVPREDPTANFAKPSAAPLAQDD
jgi:hypothetical protein